MIFRGFKPQSFRNSVKINIYIVYYSLHLSGNVRVMSVFLKVF